MRVGSIGLGNMGLPVATPLAPEGLETTGFDLDAASISIAWKRVEDPRRR